MNAAEPLDVVEVDAHVLPQQQAAALVDDDDATPRSASRPRQRAGSGTAMSAVAASRASAASGRS